MVIKRAEFFNKTNTPIKKTIGYSSYHFMHFLNPMEITLNNVTTFTKEDAFLLTQPKTALTFYMPEGSFRNHYVDFSVPGSYFDSFHIPMNTVFYLSSTHKVDDCLSNIAACYLIEDPLHHLIMESYMNLMFAQITLDLQETSSPAPAELKQLFQSIRLNILATKADDWDVKQMAALANMSVSKFYQTYEEIFHTTPKKDLNAYRLAVAKGMLMDNYELSDIASRVGFHNTRYFYQWFKKNTGITTTEYIKSQTK